MTVDANPTTPLRILLVEDSPADTDLIREALEDLDAETASDVPAFELAHADRLASAEELLSALDADLVLLDLSLPDSHGFETFLRLTRRFPELPVVVLSGMADETLAVRAVREGAQDYLVKGRVDADLLGRTLRYAIERNRSAKERVRLIRDQTESTAALRARDELLASISHDFKAPLTTIRMQAQLLSRRVRSGRVPSPEDLLEQLGRIEQTTTEATALIDELLEVSRWEAGQPVELHREPTDLVALATRIVGAYQTRVEHDRLSLSSAEPTLVGRWDSRRIERVLGNLLDNALKFSDADGEVVVSVAREGNAAVLRVRDFGIGIPAAELPRVFDRFYRGSNVSTRTHGTGIGLASAYQIVTQHGGSLDVESREGWGSTFIMRLPLDDGTRE
mgnify:FL=1